MIPNSSMSATYTSAAALPKAPCVKQIRVPSGEIAGWYWVRRLKTTSEPTVELLSAGSHDVVVG